MVNFKKIEDFVKFVKSQNGKVDKLSLKDLCVPKFQLKPERSVYVCDSFAVRFSQCKSMDLFNNVVLSLSKLKKYDDIPVINCVVTPDENFLFLCNTSLLQKISQTSQKLTVDNIRGSFLGSDINRSFNGMENKPENFEKLFKSHQKIPFEQNLERLVEATSKIVSKQKRFDPTEEELENISNSVDRMNLFMDVAYEKVNEDLINRVNKVKDAIVSASKYDVNVRGNTIEFLIAGDDGELKNQILKSLSSGGYLPKFKNTHDFGDYEIDLDNFHVKVDIKTKLLNHESCPKGYNIDKFLKFMAEPNSVYLLFLVGISDNGEIFTKLVPVFDKTLIEDSKKQYHWAGRNSRGVIQFAGKTLCQFFEMKSFNLDKDYSIKFLRQLIEDR